MISCSVCIYPELTMRKGLTTSGYLQIKFPDVALAIDVVDAVWQMIEETNV